MSNPYDELAPASDASAFDSRTRARREPRRNTLGPVLIVPFLAAASGWAAGCGEDSTETLSEPNEGRDAGPTDEAGSSARAGSGGRSSNSSGGSGGSAGKDTSSGEGGEKDASVDTKDAAPDDESDAGEPVDAGPKDAGSEDPVDEDPVPPDERIYAYVQDGPIVNLARTMDLEPTAPELDPAKGREFLADDLKVFAPGSLIAVNGVEYSQFKVTSDLTWEEGPTLSFAAFPLSEDGANFFNTWAVDDHHAYLMYDITSRVVFDPTDMKIVADKQDTKIEPMFDGLPIHYAGNRGNLKANGTDVQMAYFYKDEDWWRFADKSIIAVYDIETHDEKKLIEIPCPGLAVGSRDEDGYIYWSTWDYKLMVYLYGQGAQPCIARITPDGNYDEEFTTTLTDLTDGKMGKMFQYVRDGWGLMVLYDHEASGLDFSSPSQTEAIDKWDDDAHWSTWKIDLKNKTARRFTELGDGPQSGEIDVIRVDNHIYLNKPSNVWQDWQMYELLPDDSVVELPPQPGLWQRVK